MIHSFAVQTILSLIICLFYAFVSITLVDGSQKNILLKLMSNSVWCFLLGVFVLFCFFIVSCLTFKSLIHFELTFVYGVRECFSFILLLVAVQLSQHHLLKRLFSLSYILASLVIDSLTKTVGIYFWALYSVALINCLFLCQYHTLLMTVALAYSLKLGSSNPPALFFFLKIILVHWGLLYLLTWILKSFVPVL